ncbi:MAG: histidine phosphatase family protein [Coprobacillus sp.]
MKKILSVLLVVGMLVLSGCQTKDDTVTLYVTRHGETELNKAKKIQGWIDSPLTETGIQQAKDLSKRLENIEFSNVYSSPSQRAIDTAKNILPNADIKQDERLKEMNFGSLEGQDSSRTFEKGIDYAFEEGWKDYGGEDFYILGERAMKALDEIVKDESNKGKNVLISTHGMTILSLIYEIDPSVGDTIEGSIENCSITKITYKDGKYKIELVNDLKSKL